MLLSAEDLLAGANASFDIAVPPELLWPGGPTAAQTSGPAKTVALRPITIGTLQLIMKAAKNDPALIPLLMIKEALESPKLSLEQVRGLPLGLVDFLVGHIREVSGLVEKKTLIPTAP